MGSGTSECKRQSGAARERKGRDGAVAVESRRRRMGEKRKLDATAAKSQWRPSVGIRKPPWGLGQGVAAFTETVLGCVVRT